MTARAEFLVVGGGLAGSALAAYLARSGRDVLLVEKGRFPRDKLCGEFLSPEARGYLEELGVWEPLFELGPPVIERALFTTAGGTRVFVSLPGPGYGVSRRALDQALFKGAAHAGARTVTGVEVTGIESVEGAFRCHGRNSDGASWSAEASWVVAAHGRRARLDRALERPFVRLEHPFFGLKRHHWPIKADSGALRGAVEIHAFDGGYCGMSHVETGAVNVCCLLETSVVAETQGGDWARVSSWMGRRNPVLGARLAELTPCDRSRTQATAQVPFRGKETSRHGVLFVGDAAGVIAPLAGDGQAMAFASARWASYVLREAPDRPTPADRREVTGRYRRGFQWRFALRLFLAQALQKRLLRASSAERLASTIRAVPGLADQLAIWTRGRASAR